jgi:hypothetical protein
VERRFDAAFRVQDAEPKLAFCGFDVNSARRDLRDAGFQTVVESGLGGTKNNFDTISLHTLPNPRPVEELWPDLSTEEQEREDAERERVANENPAYRSLAHDQCGRRELAGKSVAVPFVGTTAATLATAEAVRLLHDGPRYSSLKVTLGDLGRRSTSRTGEYSVEDAVNLQFAEAGSGMV